MKRFCALTLAAVLAGGTAACGELPPDQAQESIQVFAMDTVMIVTAYGEEATRSAYDAEEEIYRLENLLSRTREDSEVSQINDAPAGTAVAVSGETADLVRRAGEWSRATGGAFDITLAPVSSAWGFTEDAYCVPTEAELAELLRHVGVDKVTCDGDTVTLAEGTRIDLGAIAKGYASDCVADILRSHNCPRGKVELGGNIFVLGDKPDGTPWRVGIQDPADPERADALAGILDLTDAYAVTSGGYQRHFEENGRTYHHIIDPATGYPADSGLTSVTVVADGTAGNGTMCDALSTALFVLGEDRALDFWRTGGYDFQLVLVTADGRVVVTDGLADVFTPYDASGYTYETVS